MGVEEANRTMSPELPHHVQDPRRGQNQSPQVRPPAGARLHSKEQVVGPAEQLGQQQGQPWQLPASAATSSCVEPQVKLIAP